MLNVTYTITDKLLGKGGFGEVYLGNDQNNKQYAIKCCEISKEIGIIHLLEPIIMATIHHPYLNHCDRIFASENKLYMIQDLARTDLAQYTRCYKENYRPPIQKLKFWCSCLLKAVSTLHNNNIIHCDIKASNILLYYDESIKLSDFNLSVLKSNDEMRYTHKVCTSTHRPLEVFKRLPWNEAVDIWSLGCTFYEVAYGTLLFPCQHNGAKAYVNSILEWNKIRNQKNVKNCQILKLLNEPNMYPIEYNSPSFVNESKDLSKILFNDLICKMLISDQYKRPNIKTLLEHSFVTNYSIKYELKKCKKSDIVDYDQTIILNFVNKLTNDDDIKNLSLKIYNDINFITSYTQELKIMTCVLIACKILHKDLPKIEDDIMPMIISIESNICNNITFHFNW